MLKRKTTKAPPPPPPVRQAPAKPAPAPVPAPVSTPPRVVTHTDELILALRGMVQHAEHEGRRDDPEVMAAREVLNKNRVKI